MPTAVSLHGHLRITAIHSGFLRTPSTLDDAELRRARVDGAAYTVFSGNNHIVDVGVSLVSRLLGFGRGLPSLGPVGITSVNDLKIDIMRIATAVAPAAPANGDSALAGAVAYTMTPLSVTYPTDTKVMFRGLLPVDALVGSDITEEGLFLASGVLVARVTFPPITKLATHALQFDHEIEVQRV